MNLASKVICNQAEDIAYYEEAGVAYPATGEWTLNWSGDIVKSSNWGMRAINAPEAWAYYKQMSTVKIGAIDFTFGPHKELQYEKVWNYVDYGDDYSLWDGHGTTVAGIMAAKWEDREGIVGVSYNEKLYAYAYMKAGDVEENYPLTTFEEKYALALLIGNGVRVINSSVGFPEHIVYSASQGNQKAINYVTEFSKPIETFLKRLTEREYDFVIVQAAGNDNAKYFVKDFSKYGWRLVTPNEYETNVMKRAKIGSVDAQYGFCFSYMQNLQDRIIVVGAYGIDDTNNISMCDFSNTGSVVSVVAPGNNIYGTIPGDEYTEEPEKGTSFAAPYVSGIAALVYSVNPELSGVQVKEIIVDTATQTLPGIGEYQETESGLGLTVPAEGQVYKCVDAGAAVEMALEESGDTPILGENTGFIASYVECEKAIGNEFKPTKDVQISAYRYSIYDGNVDDDYQYTTTTDEEGNFILCVDPGVYQLTIYKKGYVPVIIEDVEVNVGEITEVENISLIKEVNLQTKFEITGKVINALDASPVNGANIQFRKGWDETEVEPIDEKVITNENGEYFIELRRGYYTAEIIKDGYSTGHINIVVYDNMIVQTAVLSPKLKENEMRIVLTWGDSPRDLDSHMYISHGYSNQHIYYGNKTAYKDGDMMCQLDHDDTSSYGPETITLYMDKIGANYKYSVYQFSSDGDISISGARVVVYYGENEPITYHIPVQQEGRTWEVFVIENGEIIPINKRY
ncbi:MAG: S8 family serine peptidase [Lachnospiraceae bacterium]|nr:S8 family serine peptidase [Lachnospiraceae bacterium]